MCGILQSEQKQEGECTVYLSYVDLHTHTSCSDGALSPEKLAAKAEEAKLRMLAITDHNTATPIEELQKNHPLIHFVQGSEISCLYTDSAGKDHELHVVALGFDPQNPQMQILFAQNRQDRRPYIHAILEKLKLQGISVGTYEDLEAASDSSSHFGRMIIARRMVEKGYVKTVNEAFDLYLGAHGQRRAYVPNPLRYVHLEQAVSAIRAAGGVPVLAHLYYYQLPLEENHRLIGYFRHLAGRDAAMETEYGLYDEEQRQQLRQLADMYGLMHSCGSDYHGQNPDETLEHGFEAWQCEPLVRRLWRENVW